MAVVKRSKVARSPGKAGKDRQSTENFLVNKTTLNDPIPLAICHYKFVKTHKMYNKKSVCLCKLWTLVNTEEINVSHWCTWEGQEGRAYVGTFHTFSST